ncbi:MAG: chemotaxis protein CheB [Desulfosarcina sp.]|jgi:two-component system CheB/CheR fusion protein
MEPSPYTVSNGKKDMNASSTVVCNSAGPSHYVGIGASAGGLEAIDAFIKNMPPNNGLAFIFVQHLSPDYKSLMVELLSKRTQMPVHRAENGMQVNENSIYLIPPKKNLTIFHGKLILSDPERSRSGIFLPIDIFLRSLADDQGDKAIGVILSGTGSDGMRGVRAIKESGGMVMVQEENTAKFDGMPRSAISTGMADFILPPEDMPRQLLSFVEYPEQTRAARSDTILTDEDGLTRIFALLRDSHKIDFTYYKPSTVVRRIERRMTVNHINELSDYVKFLESFSREQAILHRELLIGVTSFFRDPGAFEYLSTALLPELLERKQSEIMRFWVAGCSTGEEAYTLAMVCRECMEAIGTRADIKIFATDVDNEAVIFAGNGTYPESIAADLSPHHLSKYFIRRDESFQVARNIREMVVFAQHNLIKDPPFTNIELISCRNLLIYLQPILQQKVLNHFNFSLNPGGVLFLGHSETTGEMADHFTPLDHKWKIYRSKGKSNAFTQELEISKARFNPGRLLRPDFLGPQKAMRLHEEERILDRLLEALSEDYVPLTMVVNDQMELLHVLGDATGILRYPSGRVVNNLSRIILKDLSIPLSTGIQKAFKSNEDVRYTNIRTRENGVSRMLDMRIKPFKPKKRQEPLAAVFIESANRQNGKPVELDTTSYDLDKEAAQRIQDLEQELQFTRENLQATIEELETSNEELQATNEELLASNEELQSTNQELQSVNEELHTVNAEHQRKIMELTELNNDIRNLMESSGVGTLFLDENLEVRKFTPQISQIFRIADSDIGRPVAYVNHRIEAVDLMAIIDTVTKSNQRVEKEIRTNRGQWFLMRVMPYQIGSQSFSGLIITFVDIDELKKSQRSLIVATHALNESESKFKLLADHIQDVFWIRTPDLSRMVYVSPAYETIWGHDIKALYDDPKAFLQAILPDDRDHISSQLDRHKKGIWDVEYRIEKPGHEICWIQDRGFPIHDATGRLTMMCGFASDITDHKNREELCQTSIANFKHTFENANLGMVLLDRKGSIVDSNPAMQTMIGYPRQKMKQLYLRNIVRLDDARSNVSIERKIADGKKDFYHFEQYLMDHRGQTFPANLTLFPIRDAAGKPNYVIGLIEQMPRLQHDPSA